MSLLLKVHALIIPIGMEKVAPFININVLKVQIGTVQLAQVQVLVKTGIIKIMMDIVLHSLKLVFLQQYGLDLNAKHMETALLALMQVEMVAKVTFLVKEDISGIVFY